MAGNKNLFILIRLSVTYCKYRKIKRLFKRGRLNGGPFTPQQSFSFTLPNKFQKITNYLFDN